MAGSLVSVASLWDQSSLDAGDIPTLILASSFPGFPRMYCALIGTVVGMVNENCLSLFTTVAWFLSPARWESENCA